MFAFKEWALVCAALGGGRQSIILRKGGIAEGRAGFEFRHAEFVLFPTLYHEQAANLKLPPTAPCERAADEVRIDFFACVEWSAVITDFSVAQRLAPFHIWRDKVIEERFRYDGVDALHLAFLRVYRLEPAWIFPDEPGFGGCRSWVEVPALPDNMVKQSVLSETENAQRSGELRALAGAA